MDDFRSLSFVEYAQSSSVGREKESLSNATITTTTRTPPSIGFASSENLFSYVRLPVSKSVESIAHCVVSERCVERTKERREIKSNRSPRARLIEKKNSLYLSRLSRCLGSTSPWWWCLFLFVRVLPFLCKERESVSMSAPTAQTSRFEREIRRERARERDDDDDGVSSGNTPLL